MPAMTSMQGRTAIITGRRAAWAARRPCSSRARGASIIASGRDASRGSALLDEIRGSGGRAEFVQGDVSLPQTNERLVETAVRVFGGLDTIVCFAGMLGLGSITGVTPDTWRQTLAVKSRRDLLPAPRRPPAVQLRGRGASSSAIDCCVQGFPQPRGLLRVQGRPARAGPTGGHRLRPRHPHQRAVSGPGRHAADLGFCCGVSRSLASRLGRRAEDAPETSRLPRGHLPRGGCSCLRRIGVDDGYVDHHRRRDHDGRLEQDPCFPMAAGWTGAGGRKAPCHASGIDVSGCGSAWCPRDARVMHA